MKKISAWVLFPCLVLLFSCNNSSENTNTESSELTIELKNPNDLDLMSQIISLSPERILSQNPDVNWEKLGFYADDIYVPFQYLDHNEDGVPEEILLNLDFKPGEEKTLRLKEATVVQSQQTKRTQAEISIKTGGKWEEKKYTSGEFKNVSSLRVPDEHTDHSEYIRYEGPGWESDKVGYRFYLDWRNAIDIFGKLTPEMVLQEVGLDGFDSYHEPADWGMDILKVGESLGMGSMGHWTGTNAARVAETDSVFCDITENGDLQSTITTTYYGWKTQNGKTDLTSEMSIQAGSRLTRNDISLSESLDNICTGIVKHEKANFFTGNSTDEQPWGYIATYGQQTLNDDNLGMAILFKKGDLLEITEDDHSHVIVLKPTNNKITYYFLAAWEKEPEGITQENEFLSWLDETVQKLNNPVQVHPAAQ